MLILCRREQQEILIGTDIRLRILKIHGQWVKIGIDAPKSTLILREELPINHTFGAKHEHAD